MGHSPVMQDRVLFVHAHPDDETISTGGTLALMAQGGADVTLLTCTRGESGEVIPPALAHLEGDRDALASVRVEELATALAELGVERHLFLGDEGARAPGLDPRHYGDSGMVEDSDGHPQLVPDVPVDALCSAPFDEVVADVVAAIRHTGSDAVVSYDERGGYGHPDHVLAHRAARAAAASAGVPFHVIIEDDDELARLEAAHAPQDGVTLLDVSPVLEEKVNALRAHATQVTVIEQAALPVQFALSNGRRRPVSTREGFRLVDDPVPAEPGDAGDPRPETRTSRVASGAVSLIVGVLVGTLLTINHQHRVTIGDVSVPIGIIAALVIVFALLIGMRMVFDSRLFALLAAVGIVGVSFVLSQEGPGGSVLVPANTEGFVWAYGPMVIAAVVLAWPKLPASRRARMESQPRQEGSSP